MSLTYKRLAQSPVSFLRASGLTVAMFDEIIEQLKPLWDKEITGVYKRPGRYFKMPLEDIVLMALVYYRTYTSMVWIGFLFNLNESNVSRLIRRVEPLLAKIMTINKTKELSKEDMEAWRKSQPALAEDERAYVDSGYQGLQKEHAATELPFKTTKKKPLDDESKAYNTALSRIRVTVEHIFGDIKVFGIMKNVYRNPRDTYNQKFIIMAGLVNVRNGFGI